MKQASGIEHWHLRGSFVSAPKPVARETAEKVYTHFASSVYRAEILGRFSLLINRHPEKLRTVHIGNNNNGSSLLAYHEIHTAFQETEIKQLADYEYLDSLKPLGELAYRLTYRAAVAASMIQAEADEGTVMSELIEPYIETELLDELYKKYLQLPRVSATS